MLLIINFLGALIAEMGLADEFLQYIIIPFDEILYLMGVI